MKKINYVIGGSLLTVGTLLLLHSCKTIPNGVTAVQPFNANQYLGKWYEIARLDYRFEKGLNNVTAEYSMNDDGTIKVVNKGYDYKKNEWKESTGKAKFTDSPNVGKLEVSFFGPFYSGYNVIAIDDNYQYALVVGKNHKYMWLLSRETTMPEHFKENYLTKARQLGYNTDKLVWVEHNR